MVESRDMSDGYVLRLTPAQLATWAQTTVTLAVISTWTLPELVRIGWYLGTIEKPIKNPFVDDLYQLGFTGIWAARQASTTPIEKYTQAYLSLLDSNLTTTGSATGIAKVLSDRITEARMDHLDADLSTLYASLSLIAGAIDGTTMRVTVIP